MAAEVNPGRLAAPTVEPADVSPVRAASAQFGDPLDATRADLPQARRVAALFTPRGWLAATIFADALMLVLAMGAALLGAKAAGIQTHATAIVWVFPPLAMACLAVRGMYRQKITLRILDESAHVVGATSVAAMAVVAASVLGTGGGAHATELLARIWVFAMVYVAGGRLVLGLSQRHARAQGVIGKRTLIVGAGRIGAQVERRLEEQPELGLRPVGYVDAHPPSNDHVAGREVPVLGGPDQLSEIVHRTGAEHVVLAFLSSRGSDARLVPLVRECEALGVEVSLVPRLWESINVRAELEHIGGMPLFRLRHVRPKGWQFAIKHGLDRIAALTLIVLLSPLLLLCVLAVQLTSRGPTFFRQRRVGRDGRPFDLLKFRSMREREPGAEAKTSVLLPSDTAPGGVEGADRRTGIGRLMRRTSLDELPQLLNVLKGEMSIVGPRPERPEFVELFERRVDRYDDRHRVKSGITGWAQVHGLRGKTSLSDRIEWDNYYIENWSLWLDLKILLMTISAVFYDAE